MTPTPQRAPMTAKQKLAASVGTVVAATLIVFTGSHEGEIPHTYRDAVGVLTSCNGHTGPEVHMGQTFTHEQCEDQLAVDLLKHAEGVQGCTKVELSEGEAVAYIDFTFNFGVRAYCESTLLKLLNAGKRHEACAQLKLWIKAGGRPLKGLITRRGDELTYCEKDLS